MKPLHFFGSIVILIVTSSSMEPRLGRGSLIAVKPSDYYKSGDIVSFVGNNNEIITHRIKRVESRGEQIIFVTQGDSNSDEDPDPVLTSEIIGKVYASIPYFGRLLSSLVSKKLIFFTFYSPIGFALGFLLHKLIYQ